jgi:hypothetical protein
MSNFPTLSEMGINNPGEIEHYSLSTTNNIDLLRIIYKRKKGSLLPTSKRFEFGRAAKTIMADSGTQTAEIVHDISPFLHKAISELDQLIDAKKSNIERAKLVKEEMQRLHQELSSSMSYIESLIDEM